MAQVGPPPLHGVHNGANIHSHNGATIDFGPAQSFGSIQPGQGEWGQPYGSKQCRPFYENGELTNMLIQSQQGLTPSARFCTSSNAVGAQVGCNKDNIYHAPSIRGNARAGKSKRVCEYFQKCGALGSRIENGFRETKGYTGVDQVCGLYGPPPMHSAPTGKCTDWKPFSHRTVLTKSASAAVMKTRGAFSARSLGHANTKYHGGINSARSSARSGRDGSQSLRSGRSGEKVDFDIRGTNSGEVDNVPQSVRSMGSSKSDGNYVKFFGPPKMYHTTSQNIGVCGRNPEMTHAAHDTRSAGHSYSGMGHVLKELFGMN